MAGPARQTAQSLPSVVIAARQARALVSGYPWVDPEGLAEGRRGLSPGACVALVDGQGRSLGTALAAPREPAALRLWSREGEPVTAQTVMGRTAAAWRRRAPLREREDTDAYRLVYGEGDALPGLFVDAWGPYLVAETQTAAWDPWLPHVLEALHRLERPRGVLLRRRVPGAGGAPPEGRSELVKGAAPPGELTVRESGLRYRVRLADLKPGLFLDERENRAWVASQCAGKAVLNAFAFTGAFSTAALAAGAGQVVSLDLSASVLARLKANLRLNRLDTPRHEAVRGEALATLAAWARKGRRFDVVILDPPAYATHAGGRWRAAEDYGRLAEASSLVLAPGGLLAAALCAHEVPPERFERMLREGVAKAGRVVTTLTRRGLPQDFPALPAFPEGNYLKFLAARVD